MPIDPSYYREIIMDNYTYPRHKELTEDQDYDQRHMAADSCIDDITVQAKIKDGKVEDVRFDGQACTVSTASTSILTELVEGKTLKEARNILDNYFAMIDGREYDPEILEGAVAFSGVAKQPNRIGCATIGWRAMDEMLREKEEQSNEKG